MLFFASLCFQVWTIESLIEAGRDGHCCRQCCGMCGGVFVLCKVFGRGSNLKHCWAASWLQVPPPAHFPLKEQSPLCLFGLCSLAIFSACAHEADVELRALTEEIAPTVKVVIWLHGWWYPVVVVPPGTCVVSEVSRRAAWQCISWASGWDEVSEQAEEFARKTQTETRVCC